MKNLWTLYQTIYHFELKKILSKKIVWIMVGAMLILTGLTICGQLLGGYYVDGKKLDSTYNVLQKSREAERKLTGRVIDQQLLDETWEGYGKIPAAIDHYTGTEEYWEYAFPYSAVFNFARNAVHMNISDAFVWEADEEEMYSIRQTMMEDNWDSFYLTEGEKEYWRNQELSVKKPVVYAYKEGWWMLLYGVYTIGIMAQLTTAVCLSNVFTVEQTRKTDQLIFCSRYGKGTLYLAKLLAGVSFAVGTSLLYTIFTVLLTLMIYGCDGFSAAFQLIYPDCSAPISVGEAVLIGYGLVPVGAVLASIFTMVLSEILRNGIGTLAAISGTIILSMFVNIPYHYRLLAQIWDFLPSIFLSIWGVFDCRLVPFFGTYLTGIQFVPILYILTAGILSVTGFKIYQKYQVGAR